MCSEESFKESILRKIDCNFAVIDHTFPFFHEDHPILLSFLLLAGILQSLLDTVVHLLQQVSPKRHGFLVYLSCYPLHKSDNIL